MTSYPFDNYNKSNIGKFGRGIPKINTYKPDKFVQRFMLSARAVGSIIGRGGAKAKAIRAAVPDAKINIDGDNYPERIVTVTATRRESVVEVSRLMCNNIWDDFEHEPQSKRPPRIMGKGQARCTEEAIQLCMLVSEIDCHAIIGHTGERLLQYINESQCQVFIHTEYPTGEETLPDSNEKVVTVTGNSHHIPNCVDMVTHYLLTEGQSQHLPVYKMRPWDMEKAGPSGFFGQHATWHGDGLENFPNFNKGRGLLGPNGEPTSIARPGQKSNETGLIGQPIPGLDPMIQKLDVEYLSDGTVSIKANIDQCGTIMGQSGVRIKEIRRMSGANIKINDLLGDSCLREITVNRGHNPNGNISAQNAVWLMNICVNAFGETAASACPFHNSTSLQEVVLSELYGKPPGLAIEESMISRGIPIEPWTAAPSRPSVVLNDYKQVAREKREGILQAQVQQLQQRDREVMKRAEEELVSNW